jgi:hypothetical protein|tara:strand:- start:600 stop:848 length:249 start_codon:yes stop_codon:yes gene_type:complete
MYEYKTIIRGPIEVFIWALSDLLKPVLKETKLRINKNKKNILFVLLNLFLLLKQIKIVKTPPITKYKSVFVALVSPEKKGKG